MTDNEPVPAIHVVRSLSSDGTKIISRLYLDQLNRVLAARSGDALLLRPAMQWDLAA